MLKQFKQVFFKRGLYILILLVSASCSVNAQLKDKVDVIEAKYQEWLTGSKALDLSNEYLAFKYQKLQDLIKGAHKKYDAGNFKYDNRNQRTKVWQSILLPLATSYHTPGDSKNPNPDYHSPAVKEKILDLFNRVNQSGWNENQEVGWGNMETYEETGIIGAGGSYSNRLAAYAVSVFLMRNELQEADILDRELKTLDKTTEVAGPKFDRPVLWEVGGYNTDHVIAAMQSRLCYILSQPSGKEREAQMHYHMRLSNKALTIADGFADFIKSDFTPNHHKNVYISSYGIGGLQAAALLTYILNDTPYQLTDKSVSNISQAMLMARIYSNKYTYHRGVSGRANGFSNSIYLVPFYGLLASVDSPYQDELQGAFLRYWDPGYSGLKDELLTKVKATKGHYHPMGTIEIAINQLQKGGKAEKAPNGHWYFNYAGMSVHRQNEWAVLWKGIGKYLWDYEGPYKKNENIYGKYSGAGALTILNGGKPVTEEGSGMSSKGWDWRRVPGTTSLNEPYEKVPSKKDRQFSKNVFVGGVHVDENHGMSAMQYIDNRSSLKANKSVFYFDDYIVALGTGISSGNEQYEVHTTLFQTALKKKNQETYYNGDALKEETTITTKDNKEIVATDAVNNAFYMPNGINFCLERTKQTAPNISGKKEFSNNYISGRILHGLNPQNTSYEYYINVDGGKKGAIFLQKNASKLFKVVKKDDDAHIVSYTPNNVTAYALIAANKPTNHLINTTNVPCMAMTKEINNNTLEIAVMNPEVGKILNPFKYGDIKTRETWHAKPTVQAVTLTLKGKWDLASEANAKVVASSNKETKIQFDCIDGKRIKAVLQSSK
jgi:hypothetical protein